jgi:DNA-binding NarL/FixJ family response regulator
MCILFQKVDSLNLREQQATAAFRIFQEILDNADWDVLLQDLTMPGRGGLDVLDQAKNIQPRTKILVLTMHPADQYAVRVLRPHRRNEILRRLFPDAARSIPNHAGKGCPCRQFPLRENLPWPREPDLTPRNPRRR